VNVDLKAIVGLEIGLSFYIDQKGIRNNINEIGDFYKGNKDISEVTLEDIDGYVGLDAKLSAGLSLKIDAVGSYSGMDGSVENQMGTKVIGKDGVPINASVCLPEGACGLFGTTIDTVSGKPTSVSWGGGIGEGLDIGVDLFSASIPIYYFNSNGTTKWPIFGQ
jgi:hypothetical protein